MGFIEAVKGAVVPKAPRPSPSNVAAVSVPDYYYAQRSGSVSKSYADVDFVYEVVGRISSAAGTLPVKIFQHSEADEGSYRVEVSNHPASKLLRKPNPQTPRSLLISSTVGDLCLWGNAFWLKVRPSGVSDIPPTELWRLRPDRMEPIPSRTDGTIEGWVHRIGDRADVYSASDVVHFRNYNPNDDYVGASPLSAMRYMVELGRDGTSAAIDLWRNGVTPHVAVQSNSTLSDGAIERLGRQFRSLLAGSGNRFRVPILEEGMEIRALGLNPKDSEFLNTMKLTRMRVAAAFGYPLPEAYSETVSPEEMRRALYADAVMPWLKLIEEAMELSLMDEWGSPDIFPQFLTRHILDPDMPARFAAYKDGVYAGWLPPAYVQQIEDIPPGHVTYVPVNMGEVDSEGHLVTTPYQNRGNGGGSTPNTSSGGMGGDQGQGAGPTTGSGNAKLGVPWHEGKASTPSGS